MQAQSNAPEVGRPPEQPPRAHGAIRVSPLLLEAAAADAEALYRKLGTSADGLTEEEAQRRLAEHGPNVIVSDNLHPRLKLLYHALINPLVSYAWTTKKY